MSVTSYLSSHFLYVFFPGIMGTIFSEVQHLSCCLVFGTQVCACVPAGARRRVPQCCMKAEGPNLSDKGLRLRVQN